MHPNSTHWTRRTFLRRASSLALAGSAAPLALNLAALGEAAAFNADDYKALVCVFLFGGNDHANTVVHADAERHERYRRIRGTLALARDALGPTLLRPAQPLSDGMQYALHPRMGALAALFNSGQAAILFNVGPLIVPLTKAQYLSGDVARYPVPPKLFSHNDQASVWQANDPEGATRGWGGLMGDLALADNGGSLFTCISATGSGLFVSGDRALNYQVSKNGAVRVFALDHGPWGASTMAATMRELMTEAHARAGAGLQPRHRALARRRGPGQRRAGRRAAAHRVPRGQPAGCRAAHRRAADRRTPGTGRQVFLCSLGGFDHHDHLMTYHPGLVQHVSEALAAFHQATVELGVADKVTAFTASDFGRALSSNGNGTDHGWGSHHFVVGGAVRGSAFYGVPPAPSIGETTAPDDQWHVGHGRLLPTTSVDQMAATLGRWFGATDSELDLVLPNLRYFGGSQAGIDYPRNLGFMA